MKDKITFKKVGGGSSNINVDGGTTDEGYSYSPEGGGGGISNGFTGV